MEAQFACHPEYRYQKEYPWAAWLCGLLAVIRSLFWLVGETDVVSNFFLFKYVLTSIAYLVFGVGIWNLRRWAFYGIIALSLLDIVFFMVYPESAVKFFPFATGNLRVVTLIAAYGIAGIAGNIIMAGFASVSLGFSGKSIHYRDLMQRDPRIDKTREWIMAIATALLLALLIRAYVIQAFKIPSGSMEDTLLVGDHILVSKFIYGTTIPFSDKTLIAFKEPQRGDIIVFKFPQDQSKDFIKRVVAVGGDVVKVRNKQVFVNDEPVDDGAYAVHKDQEIKTPRDNFGPETVPEGKLFVMGDNRDYSHDSRFWGFVDLGLLKGEALIIYWSWDGGKSFPRWKRIGKPVR